MFQNRTKNRKAISVVMTTLIILVSSVVLGTGVVLYGTSLFQTGGQTQSIASQGVKMWVAPNSTGYSWGAAAIRNNGDVLVSVNTIQVRGVSVPFSNMYVDTTPSHMSANFQAQFISTGVVGATGNMQSNTSLSGCTGANQIAINENAPADTLGVINGPNPLCLQQATGPTALNPGAQMIVYFRVPNSILTQIDSGSSASVNIFAGSVGGPTTVTIGNL